MDINSHAVVFPNIYNYASGHIHEFTDVDSNKHANTDEHVGTNKYADGNFHTDSDIGHQHSYLRPYR